MARKQVIIKILKSRNDVLWYRHFIGKELQAREVAKQNYYEIPETSGISKIVYKEDCELITP